MKKKSFILSCLFIVLVIYLTPAKLIEHLTPPNNQVQLSGFSGSVWSGTIGSVISKDASFSNVEFAVSPVALFAAKLSLAIEIPKGPIKGEFNISLTKELDKSIEISNANISLAAKFLEKFIPVRGASLEGKITTKDFDLMTENKKVKFIEGHLNWRSAVVGFQGQKWPLGNFSIKSSTDEKSKVITLELVKAKNKLGLQGKATLSPDGMMAFTGSISTDIDQSIYKTVALFNNGKPANGRLPIQYRQKVF
ncbi:type II secretion system protein N [Aliikangiella sp. IMCC44359]|uniref:type II secretion system protein N n=1 Tax=Aliikangiella sp. IMCC44359 TaxID=3459125 RepID=UPI00403B1CAE